MDCIEKCLAYEEYVSIRCCCRRCFCFCCCYYYYHHHQCYLVNRSFWRCAPGKWENRPTGRGLIPLECPICRKQHSKSFAPNIFNLHCHQDRSYHAHLEDRETVRFRKGTKPDEGYMTAKWWGQNLNTTVSFLKVSINFTQENSQKGGSSTLSWPQKAGDCVFMRKVTWDIHLLHLLLVSWHLLMLVLKKQVRWINYSKNIGRSRGQAGSIENDFNSHVLPS